MLNVEAEPFFLFLQFESEDDVVIGMLIKEKYVIRVLIVKFYCEEMEFIELYHYFDQVSWEHTGL